MSYFPAVADQKSYVFNNIIKLRNVGWKVAKQKWHVLTVIYAPVIKYVHYWLSKYQATVKALLSPPPLPGGRAFLISGLINGCLLERRRGGGANREGCFFQKFKHVILK